MTRQTNLGNYRKMSGFRKLWDKSSDAAHGSILSSLNAMSEINGKQSNVLLLYVFSEPQTEKEVKMRPGLCAAGGCRTKC